MLSAAEVSPTTVPTIPVVSSVLASSRGGGAWFLIHHGLPRALIDNFVPNIVDELGRCRRARGIRIAQSMLSDMAKPDIGNVEVGGYALGHGRHGADIGSRLQDLLTAIAVRIIRWLAARPRESPAP